MPRLAALATTSSTPLPLLRRVANANFRIGGPENAQALAEIASRTGYPEAIRAQALEMLGEWSTPSGRDKVVGLWRPLAPRTAGPAALAHAAETELVAGLGPGGTPPGGMRAAEIHLS